MVNQLDLWNTTDGRPSEDSGWLCVPASICAGLTYFTGLHYSPDALKDQAYGEGWIESGTAASAFVPFCLSQGVTLAKVACANATAAVTLAHQELAKGHPVIFTQQDDYAPAHPDWTHVCVWYKDTAGTLTCMDPYGGKALTFDNLTWAARLRESAVWVMEKVSTMKFDADGWLDAAIGIDATDKSMSREGHKPVIIVVHGTAGFQTAQEVGNYFASLDPNADNAASTHFVIGKDGAIVQCVNCAAAAWGNGGLTAGHKPFLPAGVNPNFYTISIEHVKNHVGANGKPDNMDTLTDAQKQASFRLIDVLCNTYSIPRKVAMSMDGGMLGHHDIDPVNKADCPGPYPWDELVAYLNGGNMPVPQGWKDDGKKLTAPNGHSMTLGFRDFVINAAHFDATNQPQEEAQAVTQVELHTQSGAGTRQILRDQMLIWTAAHGVHTSASGMEIKACYDQIATLQKQVVALQAELKAALAADVSTATLALEAKLVQIGALAEQVAALIKA